MTVGHGCYLHAGSPRRTDQCGGLPEFDAEIDSESDDALAYEARQQQEAEVMVDLLAVESGEAALV
ncbi:MULTISPECIES: hypothetical protein [unclassified Bradyrhizobium]